MLQKNTKVLSAPEHNSSVAFDGMQYSPLYSLYL